MTHCFDSITKDDNTKQTCMLEKNHSGEHHYLPDRFIKIQFGKDDYKGKVIMNKISEDAYI